MRWLIGETPKPPFRSSAVVRARPSACNNGEEFMEGKTMVRVLVVDDEEDVCEAVRRRLERQSMTVDTAFSAQEGVHRIQEADPPYDVIVTDMSMEDPDAGVRILRAAFERDAFSEVIVMTAYGNVKNAVECMKRGAYDYIEKNIPDVDVYEILTIKVEQAMDRRRANLAAARGAIVR